MAPDIFLDVFEKVLYEFPFSILGWKNVEQILEEKLDAMTRLDFLHNTNYPFISQSFVKLEKAEPWTVGSMSKFFYHDYGDVSISHGTRLLSFYLYLLNRPEGSLTNSNAKLLAQMFKADVDFRVYVCSSVSQPTVQRRNYHNGLQRVLEILIPYSYFKQEPGDESIKQKFDNFSDKIKAITLNVKSDKESFYVLEEKQEEALIEWYNGFFHKIFDAGKIDEMRKVIVQKIKRFDGFINREFIEDDKNQTALTNSCTALAFLSMYYGAKIEYSIGVCGIPPFGNEPVKRNLGALVYAFPMKWDSLPVMHFAALKMLSRQFSYSLSTQFMVENSVEWRRAIFKRVVQDFIHGNFLADPISRSKFNSFLHGGNIPNPIPKDLSELLIKAYDYLDRYPNCFVGVKEKIQDAVKRNKAKNKDGLIAIRLGKKYSSSVIDPPIYVKLNVISSRQYFFYANCVWIEALWETISKPSPNHNHYKIKTSEMVFKGPNSLDLVTTQNVKFNTEAYYSAWLGERKKGGLTSIISNYQDLILGQGNFQIILDNHDIVFDLEIYEQTGKVSLTSTSSNMTNRSHNKPTQIGTKSGQTSSKNHFSVTYRIVLKAT